jgi:hypothetical protein
MPVHRSQWTHASYRGYGWNKTKQPRLPHSNTIINVGVLGWGPIWMGKGAAAPFNGVHIMGIIQQAVWQMWVSMTIPSLPTSLWSLITCSMGVTHLLCLMTPSLSWEKFPTYLQCEFGGIPSDLSEAGGLRCQNLWQLVTLLCDTSVCISSSSRAYGRSLTNAYLHFARGQVLHRSV